MRRLGITVALLALLAAISSVPTYAATIIGYAYSKSNVSSPSLVSDVTIAGLSGGYFDHDDDSVFMLINDNSTSSAASFWFVENNIDLSTFARGVNYTLTMWFNLTKSADTIVVFDMFTNLGELKLEIDKNNHFVIAVPDGVVKESGTSSIDTNVTLYSGFQLLQFAVARNDVDSDGVDEAVLTLVYADQSFRCTWDPTSSFTGLNPNRNAGSRIFVFKDNAGTNNAPIYKAYVDWIEFIEQDPLPPQPPPVTTTTITTTITTTNTYTATVTATVTEAATTTVTKTVSLAPTETSVPVSAPDPKILAIGAGLVFVLLLIIASIVRR